MLFSIVSLVIGYAFGLIQMAYIMGKLKGIDIRAHGSGNSGSTNALRVMGKQTGAIVFAVDFAKAGIAFWLASLLFPDNAILAGLFAGLGAILGHCFPFYLGFKGGKGIACSLAIVISTHWLIGLTIVFVGIGIVLLTRYVSAASISVSALTPFLMYFFGFEFGPIFVSGIIAVICIYLHRGNIARILNGTESRLFGHHYDVNEDDDEDESSINKEA